MRQHPVNASSACYADDLRTTLNAFESRESYQSVGRLVSSSLGREHSRQQTSFVGSGRTPMYQSVTGQRLYKAVIEVEYESGGNQPSDSSDSGRTSDASECLQHKHGDTSKDRPKAQVRPPVNAKTTAHSNLHSNTTTVDYHQQGTASSGSKRKHGQFLSDPRQQSTQATQVLGYSTHKVQKGQK